MFKFILNQWILGNITKEKVLSYVPKWITAEQAQTIIATPQANTMNLTENVL